MRESGNTYRPGGQKSPQALPNVIRFLSRPLFASAHISALGACFSLPRAPLWRRCVVDLRLLCCKCESFPKWALVCSIHGRWTDHCIFFFFSFQKKSNHMAFITFYLHVLYIWLLYSDSRTVLLSFAEHVINMHQTAFLNTSQQPRGLKKLRKCLNEWFELGLFLIFYVDKNIDNMGLLCYAGRLEQSAQSISGSHKWDTVRLFDPLKLT